MAADLKNVNGQTHTSKNEDKVTKMGEKRYKDIEHTAACCPIQLPLQLWRPRQFILLKCP